MLKSFIFKRLNPLKSLNGRQRKDDHLFSSFRRNREGQIFILFPTYFTEEKFLCETENFLQKYKCISLKILYAYIKNRALSPQCQESIVNFR